MPINLAKLAANKASVAIDFGEGNTLNVEYYPQRITAQMMLDLADLSDVSSSAPQDAGAMKRIVGTPATILSSLLASWDAVEVGEDGQEQPYPLDLAHLLAIPMSTQWVILNTLIAQQSGEASASTGSGKAQP